MRKWLLIYGLIGLVALALPANTNHAVYAPALVLGMGLWGFTV